MDLDKLKEGDFIKIKGQIYEILYFKTEAGIVKPPFFKIKTFLAIYLHNQKIKSTNLTNVLYIYPARKEASLLRIEQEESKKGLFGLKNSGSVLSFKDEVKLKLEEIGEA
jgi:hypothetical protein